MFKMPYIAAIQNQSQANNRPIPKNQGANKEEVKVTPIAQAARLISQEQKHLGNLPKAKID